MIVDSHVHLNDPEFRNNIKGYIDESKKAGVDTFLCVGADLKNSIEAVEIAHQFKEVYASVGIHPTDTKNASKSDLEKIDKLLDDPKVIAVGEVGLDFYCESKDETSERQIDWFLKFIELANKHNKPIIIHSRDAINLTYEILKKNPVKKGGIIHCYSAGKDYVKKYVELGYYFGVGGVITFKNALSLKEAVKEIPLDRLLFETDAPYLAPVPHRGEKNHSKYIPLMVSEISNLKNISAREIVDKTTENFEKLFSVKHY